MIKVQLIHSQQERGQNMSEQMIFKRYEIKYMLNTQQFELLKEEMKEHMIADVHGRSTNCSLYFDTPQFLLIRRSMDHPMYKEKLRIRSYGVAQKDSLVFVELKKKYDSVTYKRRIGMREEDMERYLIKGEKVLDTQISREIDYCMEHYDNLKPVVLLSYEREAYYAKDDHEFRITFDQNILWRDYDLSLCKGVYGQPLLQPGQVLMEVKVGEAFPRWMADFLTRNKIFKTSFSKYANAYREMYDKNPKLLNLPQGQVADNKELNGGIINYA